MFGKLGELEAKSVWITKAAKEFETREIAGQERHPLGVDSYPGKKS